MPFLLISYSTHCVCVMFANYVLLNAGLSVYVYLQRNTSRWVKVRCWFHEALDKSVVNTTNAPMIFMYAISGLGKAALTAEDETAI